MHRNGKRSKSGLWRNQSSMMPDNHVVSPKDDEFQLTMKPARRKSEVPTPAAMPCTNTNKEQWSKTKYACAVDADESTRQRLEGAGHKSHQDHITAKRMNSMTHYSLVHKFIPMPQALKNSRRKGSSGERMGKTEEKSGMAADESQKQK